MNKRICSATGASLIAWSVFADIIFGSLAKICVRDNLIFETESLVK